MSNPTELCTDRSEVGTLLAAPATDKSRLTSAVAAVTQTRWCGYHQGHASSGGFLFRNGGKRWMCTACMITRKINPATASVA